jgi:hypothetical protein
MISLWWASDNNISRYALSVLVSDDCFMIQMAEELSASADDRIVDRR